MLGEASGCVALLPFFVSSICCANRRRTVGIVGATGSGKTTTVDIILGLLETKKGTLEVDGEVINKNNLRA